MEKIERVFYLFNDQKLTINNVIQIQLSKYEGPVDVIVDNNKKNITIVSGIEYINKFITFLQKTDESSNSKSRYINNYYVSIDADIIRYSKIFSYSYMQECNESDHEFIDKILDDVIFILNHDLNVPKGLYVTLKEKEERLFLDYEKLNSYSYCKKSKLESFNFPIELQSNSKNVEIDLMYIPTTNVNSVKQLFAFCVDIETSKIINQEIINECIDRDSAYCKYYNKLINKYGVFNMVAVRNKFDSDLIDNVNNFLDIKVVINHKLNNIDNIVSAIVETLKKARTKNDKK